MSKILPFGAVAAAALLLTLTALAQDKPEEKTHSEPLQRDMMYRMKELLEQTHASLAAGENDDALKKYGEFKKLYGEVQAGRITVEAYKANMEMYWKLAEEKVGPRMRKLEKEKAEKEQKKPEPEPEKKPEDKPAEEPQKEAKKKPEGAEYFPLEPGTSWTYRSGGAEALVNVSRTEKYNEKQCVVTETVSSLKIVQRQWLHITDDGIYIMKNWNPRAVEEYAKPFPRAKFPFKKDQSWTWFGKMAGKDVSYSFQVKGEKTVQVPAGKFTGLEIVTIVKVNRELTTIKEVFAPGVGLVYLERELPNRRQKQKIELVKYSTPDKEKKEKEK